MSEVISPYRLDWSQRRCDLFAEYAKGYGLPKAVAATARSTQSRFIKIASHLRVGTQGRVFWKFPDGRMLPVIPNENVDRFFQRGWDDPAVCQGYGAARMYSRLKDLAVFHGSTKTCHRSEL